MRSYLFIGGGKDGQSMGSESARRSSLTTNSKPDASLLSDARLASVAPFPRPDGGLFSSL